MARKDPAEVLAHKRAHDREYRAANREQISARRKARYAEDAKYRKQAIARAKASYAANPEKGIARAKARREADPERANAESRARYAKDSKKWKVAGKKWADANPEKVKAKERAWRKANPEKVCARQHRRRARVNGASGTYTVEDIRRQHDAQKGLCYWCRKPVGKKYHVDHVVPLDGKERKGSNWPCNLVVACPRCNFSKGHSDPQEFAGILL